MSTRSSLALALLATSSLAACGSTASAPAEGAGGDTGGEPPGAVAPQMLSGPSNSFLEAETSIAVTADGVVAAAYIGESFHSTNGYNFSVDDGQSWQAGQRLDSPGGIEASDPVLTADPSGNLYMVWLGFKRDASGQNPSNFRMWVAKAAAGTTQFVDPVQVGAGVLGTADQLDKPWITTLADGALLATFARTSTGGVLSARSDDAGQSWDVTTIAEDGRSFANLAYPCQAADTGRTYVVYIYSAGFGAPSVRLQWSDDRGDSWPSDNVLDVQASGEPTAFEDPTCVASGNDVWVSYGLSSDSLFGSMSRSPKLDAVRVAHSGDGGVSVAERVDAHDGAAGRYFSHPQLARTATGALELVYYAGQSDGDTAGTLVHARSEDGGATFAPSEVIASPITLSFDRASQLWLGDYVGVAAARDSLYVSYVDNTRSSMQGPTSHVAVWRGPAR